ncbi:hypothetical protein LWI29_035153 [Acer saccharum]|uniref:Uncharacterized protein n=1 Tax=Acer saccharum TaxID=4024 RepID=A0AA39RPW6_ACESA|nr:hypothetical protein LWI29_035153 [Acer saccharum]
MAERGSASVITLGGKGSSLTSSSVHAIAHGFSQVRIDSAALDRLASLDSEEAIDVTEEELVVLEGLSLPSVSCGICAVLDYQSTALTTIIDVAAALSCEASGADVAPFGSMDSGDGFTAKEEIGVAGDLKVLLNGSKLVGKMKSEEVLEIPKINGKLREVVKSVHSSTRIELNSSMKAGISGTAKALVPMWWHWRLRSRTWGSELLGEKVNGGDVRADKSEKKKKKVVLGKGTGVIVQLIKDRLQSKGSVVLEKWVEDIFLFLDPKEPEFDGLLIKVKEILETNESRRLPKLPKGTRDFAKEQMAIREKAFSIISDVF